jgi:DNA-binding transcriptional ArsR family regulator
MKKSEEKAMCGLTPELVIQRDALADKLARTYKALGDATRVKMLLALSEQELCVHEIASLLDMTHSAVSHQLQVLRKLRIVRHKKSGRHVFYALDDDHIADMLVLGMEHVCHN